MKLNLRQLILALAIASLALTLASTLFASYKVQKESIIKDTLEANLAYATKVAYSIEALLLSAQQQLSYSAQFLAQNADNKKALELEAKRLMGQSNLFNSIVITNAEGRVLATNPELGLTGQMLTSETSQLALAEQKPTISQPFVAQTGRFLVTISSPIFDSHQHYLGYISGTIYLQEPSILNTMMSSHFYQDGSYVYIVDQQKRLIQHPISGRIGEVISGNIVVDNITTGQTGSMGVTNSQGVEMLAGYALVPGVLWGVVAQKPLDLALNPLQDLVSQILLNALPLTILIICLIIWCAKYIASPLHKLADSASTMDNPEATTEIQKISTWYFEIENLKKALLIGINLMQGKLQNLYKDAETDALTGLANRRAYEKALNEWPKLYCSIAIIAIDIDHFKKINDTYGHDTGDIVLKHLASIMQDCCRRGDIACRVGGEEFSILVPNASASFLQSMAERLRHTVQSQTFDIVGQITISIGVAIWPNSTSDMSQLAKIADNLLYQAKNNGRNRVELDLGNGTSQSQGQS